MRCGSRVIDQELADALASAGAVLIEGPKACGKTESARRIAKSEVLLDVDEQARAAVSLAPDVVLDGPTPRLIDGWQHAPGIRNLIRRAADDRGGSGHFVLTGSAVPRDDHTRHVGAGRFIRLRMRPMSLAESGHSTGQVSLRSLLAGEPPRAERPSHTVRSLAELTVRGGWPGGQGSTLDQVQRVLRGYVDEIARADVQRVDGIRRDPDAVARLLRSLARNVATPVSINALRADVNGADGNLRPETVSSYLGALERSMVIENLLAWAPAFRSRTRLRAAAVRHFVDPSLAAVALRATPDRLLNELRLLGFLIENLVMWDLRVYAQALEGQVFAYRDGTGLEVDAIIEMPDGGRSHRRPGTVARPTGPWVHGDSERRRAYRASPPSAGQARQGPTSAVVAMVQLGGVCGSETCSRASEDLAPVISATSSSAVVSFVCR